MKQPFLRDDAFLRDVVNSQSSQRLNIWWLGQSGFLVQCGDAHLLLDPYLSDSLTKKYANTDKPHIRITERVIAPERLDFIDVVTSTHNHTDHLDSETVIPLLAANPELTIIVPRANVDFAAKRFDVSPERLTSINVGEWVEVGDFTCCAVPAAHEQVETDATGNHKFVGYIVKVRGFTIYHSGDTLLFDGLIKHLAQPIDVAILPINGRDPARGVAGNLSAAEAVHLAQAIGVSVVIPCHFDMFEFNTVSPEEFVALAEQANQPYALLRNGERLTLNR
jgi:L-ascorbate metabolism protein UlaG (beta-lactamase superfamily)